MKRLNQRSTRIIESLAADPAGECELGLRRSWSETIAAYRFFNNSAVEAEPHSCSPMSMPRNGGCTEHPVVLIAQDTTELDFSAAPSRRCGLPEQGGSVWVLRSHASGPHAGATVPGRGGVVSSLLAPRKDLGKTQEQRANLPIEQKESFRWLSRISPGIGLGSRMPRYTNCQRGRQRSRHLRHFPGSRERIRRPPNFVIRAKAKFARTPERDPDVRSGCLPQSAGRSECVEDSGAKNAETFLRRSNAQGPRGGVGDSRPSRHAEAAARALSACRR